MSEKPWERDWSGQGGSAGGGKPWERNWAGANPPSGNSAGGAFSDITRIIGELKAGVPSGKPAASGDGVDFWDEVSRGFNNINENWIAPSLGMPVDLVNQGLGLVGLGSDKPFGGTESLRSGMRDVGAAKGQDYMPKTKIGGLLSDVAGGVAAVLPVLATAGAAAPAMAPGVGSGVVSTLAAAPGAQMAAGAGAGAGDFVADQVAPNDPWARLGAQLLGSLGGSMLTVPPQPDDVIAAFERQDVPVSAGLTAGQTGGGKTVQATEAGLLGSTIGGSGTVRNTYDDAERAIGSAVDRLANQTGAVQSSDDLGRVLQGSVGRTMADVSQQADQAFSAIGGLFGPNDAYLPNNAIGVLRNSFDGIDDPALAAIFRDSKFGTILDAMMDPQGQAKALSYDTLKGMRSAVGRAMNRLALDGGVDNAQWRALYGALTDDMTAALQARGGQQAVTAFNNANAWYTTQMERARNSLQPLVGKNAPVNAEKAFETLYSAAKAKGGNLQRLEDIYAGLLPQEQADVSASVLARLGRKGDEPFSVARFMADYSALGADAKDLLFNQQLTGPLRQAYDDLLETIMPQFRRATRFINRSNTGLGVVGGGQAVLAVQQAMSLDILTAVGTIAGPAVMAKAMTNPTAVKLMAAAIARGQSAAQIAAQVTAIIQAQQQGAKQPMRITVPNPN